MRWIWLTILVVLIAAIVVAVRQYGGPHRDTFPPDQVGTTTNPPNGTPLPWRKPDEQASNGSSMTELLHRDDHLTLMQPIQRKGPFAVGDVWKGTLTQESRSPNLWDAELRLSSRDGINYEGDWHATAGGLEVRMKVRGTIEQAQSHIQAIGEPAYKIKLAFFEGKGNTHAVKSSEGDAEIRSENLDGNWSSTDGSQLSGRIHLRRVQ